MWRNKKARVDEGKNQNIGRLFFCDIIKNMTNYQI